MDGDLERFVLSANCLSGRPCHGCGGHSRQASQLQSAIPEDVSEGEVWTLQLPVVGLHGSEDIACGWTGGVTLAISYENVVKPGEGKY